MNIRALTHLVALVAPLYLVACNGEVDPGRRTRGDSASSSDNGAAGKPDAPSSDAGAAGASDINCDPADPTKNPGVDPGKDPSEDPGEYPGKDPNGDPSKDPPSDPGSDPGKDPGKDPGVDPGKDPGVDPGKDPNGDPGKDPGVDPGKDPGSEPSFTCVWDVIEKGGACLDPTEIKDIAIAKCGALGGFVSALDQASDCVEGSTLVKLSCCVDLAALP